MFHLSFANAAILAALGATAFAADTARAFEAPRLHFSADYVTEDAAKGAFGLSGNQGSATLAKTSFNFINGKGASYGFGTGGTDSGFFGLESLGGTPVSFSGEGSRFNAPYLGLAENATHGGYSATLQGGVVVRFGAVRQVSKNIGAFGGGDALVSADAVGAGKSIAVVEIAQSFGDMTGVLTVGRLNETNSVMGMTGSGALALGASPRTTFVTLAASKALSDKTTFSVMVSLGRTSSYQNRAASVIDGASSSSTAAWSLGLAQQDVLRSGDRLGLTISMPLKTMSGSMQVTTAVGQNQEDGTLQFATRQLALRPTGTQQDLDLAYACPVAFGGVLSAIAQAKFQPGHESQAATQFGVGVKYTRTF